MHIPSIWADFALYFLSLQFTLVFLGYFVIMLQHWVWYDVFVLWSFSLYFSVDCQLQLYMHLCFDLKSDMDASYRVFGNGSLGVLSLTLELEVSNYLSPVAFLLAPHRGSLIRYLAILMVLFNISSLLVILSVCGKFLLCYISLAIYSQVQILFLVGPVCYPNFSMVISLALFYSLKHVSSFGLLCQYWILLVRCLCVLMSLSSGFFGWVIITVTCIDITSICVFNNGCCVAFLFLAYP